MKQKNLGLYMLLTSSLFGMMSSYSFVSQPLAVTMSMVGGCLLFIFLAIELNSVKKSIIVIDSSIRQDIEVNPILLARRFNDLKKHANSTSIATIGMGGALSGMASTLFLNGFNLNRAISSQSPCAKQSASSAAIEDVGVTAVGLCTMIGFGAYVLSAKSLGELTRIKSEVKIEEITDQLRIQENSTAESQVSKL